jgi:hypothetical protein
LLEKEGHLLLIRVGRDQVELLHAERTEGHLAAAPDHARERHRTHGSEADVDDEDLVEIVRKVLVGAQEVERLADRPIIRQGHELARHEPAGRIFRKGEPLLQAGAFGKRQGLEDRSLERGLEVGKEAHRIVGLEAGDDPRRGLGSEILDESGADLGIEISQRIGRELLAERAHEPRPVGGVELLQEIGEIGRVERNGEAGGEVERVGRQRLRDLGEERLGEPRGVPGRALFDPPVVRGRLAHGASTAARVSASTQATALMLTIPRAVTEAFKMCAGRHGPIRIGPIVTASLTALTRL